ncbi:MAG: minichromosome maintenance protein MCM [Euryarchaeota archaeon]|nr:minichromosome maintenance protein MCM [Euryarchaeota archaeon]
MEIEYEDFLNRFRDFFLSYPDVNDPVYKKKIDKMKVSEEKSLKIDCDDLLDSDPELYEAIAERPVDVIPIAEDALKSILQEEDVFVRFCNAKSEGLEIRNLRAIHVNKFIQIKGVVGRSSEVKPEIVEAAFQCQRCGQLHIIKQDEEFFKKPRICENPACGRKGPFKLLEDQSKFRDWQVLKIQERPEKLRGGRMPRRINLILRNDIVDKAKAGERVTVAGILKTVQESTRKGKKTTFRKYVDINSMKIEEQDIEQMEITKEEEEKIKNLSQDPFVIDKITGSIAPSIYGYHDIKEAIAIQLFSGVIKELPDGTRLRGDSNILLVGDPGVAKSQLLLYASKVAPRSLYTSGKGTSAAGLTAAVVRDETTGGWALEAGALVIADGGIACVDEMDKMDKDDRSSIHEAMEQQTVSIAKAGIVATLNARSAILAASNPKYGRFDRYKSFAEQIDLPPTLISRFDLVFVMTDTPNEERDRATAQHILDVHRNAEGAVVFPVEPDLLKKYIMYAKTKKFPTLSKGAERKIHKFYVKLRKIAEEKDAPVPITARQLEALIRLSEARARMRLSNEVTAEDSEAIIKLFKNTLFKVGVDPETGELDIDVIMTGNPKSQRDKMMNLLDLITSLDKGEGVSLAIIIEEAKKEGIDKNFVRRYIEEFKQKGDLYEPKPDVFKVLR